MIGILNVIQWKKTIQAGHTSLTKNKTLQLTTLPTNIHLVSSKWVFKINTKSMVSFKLI
jgi:hypothetical protein